MKFEVGWHADFCIAFCIALILHNYKNSIFMFTASKQNCCANGMGLDQTESAVLEYDAHR